MSDWKTFVLPAALVFSTSAPCFATIYLTADRAQKVIFPGASCTPWEGNLTDAQKKAIEKASALRIRKDPQIWHVSGGGWFIVDEVVGKHEYITLAVGLTAGGAVKQVEIMEYRESYGSEVRSEKWRAQFVGKTTTDPLRLDQDIKNISGATLSSRHVTEGVRRACALYEIALK
jgi:hypothetical protein